MDSRKKQLKQVYLKKVLIASSIFVMYSFLFILYLILEYNQWFRIILFIPCLLYPIISVILFVLIILYINYRELLVLPKQNIPHIIEYNFLGYDKFLELICKNAHKKGYIYNRKLIEDNEYEFTVFTKVDTKNSLAFPNEKIAIYRSKFDGGESLKFNRYNRKIKIPKVYVMGKELNYVNENAFEFLRMFTNKKGHLYSLNAQWVTIDSIVIIVVDELDKNLEYILNYSFQELYVLYCVISLQEPNKIYVAQDNRIMTGEDYINKVKELKEILEGIS